MKVQGLFITIAAMLVVSCNKDDSGNAAEQTNSTTASQNSAGTGTATGGAASDLDALAAKMEAEARAMEGGDAKLDGLTFFDPAWANGLGSGVSQTTVDEIRRVMFMAKGNQSLQGIEPFRYFVAALYDCNAARKASYSEFDKAKILDAAMQRLNAYLATQPDTFVWETKDEELGKWNPDTQRFGWSAFDSATFTPTGPSADPSLPCSNLMPLAYSSRQHSRISFQFANQTEIESRVGQIGMDEQTARQFVEMNPKRTITARYTWVSKPTTRGYIYINAGDKIFRPVVSKVEIINPANGAVLSTTTL